jgi:hypothetical protein
VIRRHRHWTRQLDDGRIEFYMRDGSAKLTGAADFGGYLLVRRMFEAWAGHRLPAPEHKHPRRWRGR